MAQVKLRKNKVFVLGGKTSLERNCKIFSKYILINILDYNKKQIKERYKNFLEVNAKRASWTVE